MHLSGMSQVTSGFIEVRMKKDFDLIKHTFKGQITIIPISDVHLGALEHCESEWNAFCNSVCDKPNTYIILGGDLINNSIRTSVANPFDEVIRPREQKKRMVEYLSPIKSRILCAVSGNHERRSMKDADEDITYDIMSKLDLEDLYRENVAFMKIGCGKRSDGLSECVYMFCVTHGAGGGIYTGAGINRNERFGNVIDGLDCLIVGHTHKGTVSKPSKIVLDVRNELVSVKSYTVISCVSWLNYGGYAAQKMLLPADRANPQKILLNAKRDYKNIEVRW